MNIMFSSKLQKDARIRSSNSTMESNVSEVTAGEILRKAPTMAFEWKIRDFFTLLKGVDYCIQSPIFRFLDAEWRLEICSNVEEFLYECMTLYVCKVHSNTKSHNVTYYAGIIKQGGTDYNSISGTENFEGNESCWGNNLLDRSTLLEMKSEIAPQDTVTIYCIFHSDICEKKEVASQTMQPEGFEKLLQNFRELFNGEDSDVVLRVKDEEFKAHKAILKVRSPVFKSMFSHGMKEDSSGVVEITDCDPAAFRDFLYYLYCGKVEEFSADKVFHLYFVADKYDVDELKTKCVKFITDNISMGTFFDSIMLSLRHNESLVLKHATDFFIENSINIVKTAEWLSFLKENPVESNELFVKVLENKISK